MNEHSLSRRNREPGRPLTREPYSSWAEQDADGLRSGSEKNAGENGEGNVNSIVDQQTAADEEALSKASAESVWRELFERALAAQKHRDGSTGGEPAGPGYRSDDWEPQFGPTGDPREEEDPRSDSRTGEDAERSWSAAFERELRAGREGRARREQIDNPSASDEAPPVSGRPTSNRSDNRAYERLPAPRPQSLPVQPDGRGQIPAAYTPNAGYGGSIDGGPGLDLRKYLWLLLKHRWLLLGAAVIGTCFGVVSTYLQTPIYRASATIQINRDVPQIVAGAAGAGDFLQVDGGQSYEFYQTQYELLKSRAVADRVVATLNLQDDASFLATNVPSPLSNLKRIIFGVPPQTQATASVDVTAQQKVAAGRVMGGMGLQPINNSTIVMVTYDSPNPAVAQKVANGIVDAYIAENLDRRYGAATYARTFLEDHLKELKLKLEDSEKQLVAYADQQHMVSAAEGQAPVQPDLAAANDQLTKAASERMRLALLWNQVQSSDGISVPQMLESKTIADLRAKRGELETAYQDKLSFFKPAYPEMKKLKAQIDEIDQQIAEEVNLIKQSIKSQYDTAVATEQSLAKHAEDLKTQVTDFRNLNIQYTILQREVDTNRSLYDGLLQRYKEIGVAGGVGANNVSVVDRADGAGMISPNLRKNLMMSLMLGLLLGAGLAFGREQLDDTFKSPEDLEEALGIPLLGIIPATRSASQLATALDDPRSAVTEAFRSLRTALQFSTSAGVPKTLLVTSSRAGEGKSTTAVMLARNYAQVGMKVLLIDADLRKPSLHQHIECDVSAGLTNCLASAAVASTVFQKTKLKNLTFMPSGPLPPNPAELLAGPKMLALLTTAAELYDLVILDGPPVAGIADAPLLSSVTAGTLFVIDGAKTRRKVTQAALKRLHFARAQVVGAVINKLNVGRHAYGYAYAHAEGDYYGHQAPIADKQAQITAKRGGATVASS